MPIAESFSSLIRIDSAMGLEKNLPFTCAGCLTRLAHKMDYVPPVSGSQKLSVPLELRSRRELSTATQAGSARGVVPLRLNIIPLMVPPASVPGTPGEASSPALL